MPFHTTASGLVLPNSVSIKKKPSDDFDALEVFARNGIVCFRRPNEDGSDVDFTQISVDTARTRRKKLIEERDRHKELSIEHKSARDKLGPLARFIDRLTNVIKEAEEQGPFQYADMRRARVRSAPTSVSVVKYGEL